MDESLKSILARHGFGFSHSLGQNFISDRNLLKSVCSDAEVEKTDTVIEVGAGAGTLTRELAAAAGRVIAFEVDETLRPVLCETLSECENIEMIFSDVLKWDLSGLLSGLKHYKLVANLPYYITTPVLFAFTESGYPPSLIAVTVQKEVADRIIAKPGTGDYGALTASLGTMYSAEVSRKISRELFTPKPNVDSAVAVLRLRPDAKNSPFIRSVIKAAFSMRRKTLANNLSAAFGINKTEVAEYIAEAGFDIKARGETLSPDDFIKLSRLLSKKLGKET